MILRLIRYIYKPDSTIGKLFNHQMNQLSYTLEDVVRQYGAKVPKLTAIPAGNYEVIVSYSDRFKRFMPLLLNVVNFSGIRMHGGNKPEDTDGCILVAKNLIPVIPKLESNVSKPNSITYQIQETQEKQITALIQSNIKSEKCYLNIVDTYPFYGV